MAIANECCSCDKPFINTQDNQGSVCPNCLEEAEAKKNNLKEEDFWDYMIGREENNV